MAQKKKHFNNPAMQFISAADAEEQPEVSQQETPRQDLRQKPQKQEPTSGEVPKGYMLVKENKSERMQLLIRPALKDAIRAEAEAQGLSMNDLVNNIFEEYIERKGKA